MTSPLAEQEMLERAVNRAPSLHLEIFRTQAHGGSTALGRKVTGDEVHLR